MQLQWKQKVARQSTVQSMSPVQVLHLPIACAQCVQVTLTFITSPENRYHLSRRTHGKAETTVFVCLLGSCSTVEYWRGGGGLCDIVMHWYCMSDISLWSWVHKLCTVIISISSSRNQVGSEVCTGPPNKFNRCSCFIHILHSLNIHTFNMHTFLLNLLVSIVDVPL